MRCVPLNATAKVVVVAPDDVVGAGDAGAGDDCAGAAQSPSPGAHVAVSPSVAGHAVPPEAGVLTV